MSRDKELEKTPVKNTDKNLATTTENTEAAAAIIPWASAGSTGQVESLYKMHTKPQ